MHIDGVALLRWHPGHVATGNFDASFNQVAKSGDRAQECRLPGAGRAHEHEALATSHLEVDVPDDDLAVVTERESAQAESDVVQTTTTLSRRTAIPVTASSTRGGIVRMRPAVAAR